MKYTLPQIHVFGTHYEVGLEIGKEFSYRINKYIQTFTGFNESILPFIQTNRGRKCMNGYIELISDKFPWLIDEMKGLADGSGVPYEHILAINLRVELLHLASKKDECIVIDDEEAIEARLECSDFYISNNTDIAILHNEDAQFSVYDTCYFVHYRTRSTRYANGLESPEEAFTCLCYAGHLPGNAYAFNSSGFLFTVNALCPKQIALNRFPRQIMSRIILSCKTLEEIEQTLLNVPLAYGFCLNIGFFGQDMSNVKTLWNSEYFKSGDASDPVDSVLWNYELAPSLNSNPANIVSKHCLSTGSRSNNQISEKSFVSSHHYYHFNHYERINIDELVVNSSRHRRARGDEMEPPASKLDLLRFAFDTGDKKYPIYRELGSNQVVCTSTALFDLRDKKLSIYVGSVSKQVPIIVMPMM